MSTGMLIYDIDKKKRQDRIWNVIIPDITHLITNNASINILVQLH